MIFMEEIDFFDIISLIRNSWIYNWFKEIITPHKNINIIEEPSSRIWSMRSNNQNSSGVNSGSSGVVNRSVKETPEKINESPIYENKYIIIGAILVITTCLIYYFYYKGSNPDNNPTRIESSENLKARLKSLFDTDISDTSSNISDKTITKYFKDSPPNEFIQGSSTQTIEQLVDKEYTSNFWNLPITALSSTFLTDTSIDTLNDRVQEIESSNTIQEIESPNSDWNEIKVSF